MMSKTKLNLVGDRPLLGAFLGLPVPALVEVVGRVGFDFIILDGEHGGFTSESLEECMRAADTVKLPTVVRIPEINPWHIQMALDAGAQAVQVPAVETPEQARLIVSASHFPPKGRRGFGSTTRAAGYGFIPRSQVIRTATAATTVIIQVETRKGVERLSDILAVDGVDMVFLGTNDLSLDYGYESPADPDMLPLVQEMIRTIRESGKMCGVHATGWEFLPMMKELGVHYFTISALAVMGLSLQGLVTDFEKKVKT